jgi:DNA segregation ATPase FtsK/SpoIIIE-like protein
VTEEEYAELEPLYHEYKVAIPAWPEISVSKVQRDYRFGYNRACRLLETLAEHGHLHWDPKTGKYSRPS